MPLTDQNIEHRIRLALSWREKTRKLAASARVDDLRDFYQHQQQAAQASLEAVRAIGIERIEAHAEKLRHLLADEGTDARTKEKIETVRLAIARLNLFLSAESPEVAGGYLDLPLDAYARELAVPAKPSPAPLIPMPPLWQWLAVALIGVIAWTAAQWYLTRGQDVRFDATLAADSPEHIAVQIANHQPLALELDLAAADVHETNNAWKIAVSIKADHAETFQLLPDCLEAWRYRGQPLHSDAPIEIPPRMSDVLALHTDTLRNRVAAQIRTIRLELISPAGTVAAATEIVLPGPLAHPASSG